MFSPHFEIMLLLSIALTVCYFMYVFFLLWYRLEIVITRVLTLVLFIFCSGSWPRLENCIWLHEGRLKRVAIRRTSEWDFEHSVKLSLYFRGLAFKASKRPMLVVYIGEYRRNHHFNNSRLCRSHLDKYDL